MGSRRALFWAIGVVLALALAGAAATFVPDEPSSAASEGSPPAQPASTTAGEAASLNVSELPTPTGWILVPLQADAETNVVAHVDADVRAHRASPVGAVAFLAEPNGSHGEPELSAAGDIGSADRSAEVNHGGRGLACCPSDDEAQASFAFGSGAVLTPGETAYLGIVVVNASQASLSADVDVLRSAEPGALAIGEPQTGTAARAVDLVDHAEREGTNARYGTTQVGDPAEASLTAEAERSTVGFLGVELADDSKAELELAMPEPHATEELGAGVQGDLAIAAGPGETTATLSGLGSEEAREAVGSATDSEARLVLADLPLPIRAADRSLAGPGEGRPSPAEVKLTDGELPADTGWFLAPLEVPEPSSVHVQIELGFDETPSRPYAALPILADAHDVRAPFQAEGHEENLRVAAADREATCCPPPFEDGTPGGAVSSGFFGASPDEPLYVGLVAANWSQAASLSIYASAQGTPLEVGPVATGTDVAFLDLFRESSAQPSVQTRQDHLLGGYEDLQRSWSPDDTGLISVRWDLQNARGDVTVELANGTELSTAPSQGTEGRIFATHEGAIDLRFEEARRSESDAHALALVADLPLPREDARLEQDDA